MLMARLLWLLVVVICKERGIGKGDGRGGKNVERDRQCNARFDMPSLQTNLIDVTILRW